METKWRPWIKSTCRTKVVIWYRTEELRCRNATHCLSRYMYNPEMIRVMLANAQHNLHHCTRIRQSSYILLRSLFKCREVRLFLHVCLELYTINIENRLWPSSQTHKKYLSTTIRNRWFSQQHRVSVSSNRLKVMVSNPRTMTHTLSLRISRLMVGNGDPTFYRVSRREREGGEGCRQRWR